MKARIDDTTGLKYAIFFLKPDKETFYFPEPNFVLVK